MKFLFFDVDGTLLDFNKCEEQALKNTLLEKNLLYTKEINNWYNKENARLWELYNKGIMEREDVLLERFRGLINKFSFDAKAEDINSRYRFYLGREHALMKGAVELLSYLKPKYKLYVVTNGVAATQHIRINNSGLGVFFEKLFISEEIGFQKPRVEFFDACFAEIENFDKAESMIIGDSLSADIQGGINSGIKTCWLNQENTETPDNMCIDYEIKSLEEIYKIL